LIDSVLGDSKWLFALWMGLRVAAIAYAGFLLLIFLVQRSIVFPGSGFPAPRASPDQHPPAVTQIWLETSFGRVEAWYLEASVPGPVVIFAHGNGEFIDDWTGPMERLRSAGVSVLLVEFPGYGHSDGRPSRRSIAETFEAAFDRVVTFPSVDRDRVVAVGRSLGGGAAADLALARPVAALVLMSTFSSAADVAWSSFRVPSLAVRDRFDVRGAVARFSGPVLLMHGRGDDVLPFRNAERIAAARSGLEVVPLACRHNDCLAVWPETAAELLAFLDAEGLR
jgi:uncharacterized protein